MTLARFEEDTIILYFSVATDKNDQLTHLIFSFFLSLFSLSIPGKILSWIASLTSNPVIAVLSIVGIILFTFFFFLFVWKFIYQLTSLKKITFEPTQLLVNLPILPKPLVFPYDSIRSISMEEPANYKRTRAYSTHIILTTKHGRELIFQFNKVSLIPHTTQNEMIVQEKLSQLQHTYSLTTSNKTE